MKRRALLVGVIIWLMPSFGWPSSPPQFTEQEKAWIAAHPIVRTRIEPDWRPFEFRKGGKIVGVVPSYLDAISRISGLRFEYVDDLSRADSHSALMTGKVDLVPDVSKSADISRFRGDMLISQPYFVGTMVVVAPERLNLFVSFRSLSGRRIAIKGNGALEYAIRQSGISVTLITYNDERDALEALVDGQADVAIGTDISILPLLRRQFQGQLFLTGGLPDRPYALSMATRSDMAELASILDKSLATISARETEEIARQWIEMTDYGKPSLRSIFYYRRWQVAAVGATLLALIVIAFAAWRARVAAIRSERDKAMFLAFISHEIRTPMQTILSSLELLQRAKLAPKQANQVGVAVAASESLLTLLDDVLDYSRLESRNVALALEPTQVGPWAQRTADMVRWRLDEKNLSFTLELAGPPELGVLIDPLRVRQIVLNLLVNAIKFTSVGTVGLRVDYLEGKPGRTGSLVLEVRDTGIGIPPVRQHRIFEPYQRVEEPGSRRVSGSGLGLSICRELVALMKGVITVSSSPDKGTIFTVILPARRAAQAAMPGTTVPAAGPVNDNMRQQESEGPMILVVDDHEAVRHAIGHQLDALACRSAVAGDGAQALDRFERARYDMVLLDCDLPDIDGYAVAQRIRASEQRREQRRTPIIAISASTDDAHREHCFDSGMDGVLSKPLRLDALRQIIDLWCPTYDADRLTASALHVQSAQSDFPSIYRQNINADLVALGDALSAGDSGRARHAAHRIKGAAAIAGHGATSDLAAELERRLRVVCDGIPPDADALYDALSNRHRADTDDRATDDRHSGDAGA